MEVHESLVAETGGVAYLLAQYRDHDGSWFIGMMVDSKSLVPFLITSKYHKRFL